MRVHIIGYSILTGCQCWRYAAAGAAEPAGAGCATSLLRR